MFSKSSLPLSFLVLVGLSGYLGYELYTHKVPCVTPMSYSLASYDARFGFAETTVKADIDQAAEVWNKALGRKVFVKEDEVVLPITFVYDHLQRTLDTIDSINSSIDADKDKLKALGNEYATKKKEFDALNRQHNATQAMADELNALIKEYNALVKKINASVAQEQHLPVGQETAGKYVSDETGTRIYIYGFEDERELKSTLIHEFGHALGLDHVSEPNAVMYPTDNSTRTTLAEADLAELARACSEQKTALSEFVLAIKDYIPAAYGGFAQ